MQRRANGPTIAAHRQQTCSGTGPRSEPMDASTTNIAAAAAAKIIAHPSALNPSQACDSQELRARSATRSCTARGQHDQQLVGYGQPRAIIAPPAIVGGQDWACALKVDGMLKARRAPVPCTKRFSG